MTGIEKRDSARELDLARVGYDARIRRELGSTWLLAEIDLTDFDRLVNALRRHGGEDSYEAGYEAGWLAAVDNIEVATRDMKSVS